MAEPMTTERLDKVRAHLAYCRETGDMTLGDVYARDLLEEVDRMRDAINLEQSLAEQISSERDEANAELERVQRILAALSTPGEDLAEIGATAWRDHRVTTGALYGDRPVRPTGAIVGLVGEVLRSSLPSVIAHLETQTGGEK